MKTLIRTVSLVLCCIAFNLNLQAQAPSIKLTSKLKRQVIEHIADSLKVNYIFADTALKMGNFIKYQLKKGVYDTIKTPDAFALALQEDIRRIYPDGHLRVSYNSAISQNEAVQNEEVKKQEAKLNHKFKKLLNLGFQKAEMLPGNIGYMDIRMFFSPEADVKAMADAALRLVSNSDALIIDLRKNMGGEPETIQYICNYLFSKRTHLNDIYTRRADTTYHSWTKPDTTFKALSTIPIYVLTSHRTFSGGEELSYDLQAQKRAVIIGEVTGGGAHPVAPFSASNGFVVDIPYEKAINPVTKTSWEAVGVKPDIQVEAGKALDVALELIKKSNKVVK